MREDRFHQDDAGAAIAEPQTKGERMAYGVGKQAPAILAGSMFTGPAMGLGVLGVLGEMGLGVAGATAAEATREAGGGFWAQTGADVLTSAIAPSTAGAAARRVVGRTMGKASSKSAKSAVDALSKQGYKGAKPLDAYRAAKELRGDIATGTVRGDRFVDEARERIATARDVFEGGPKPSLAAVEGELGGANAIGREMRLAKADPHGYGSPAHGRKLEVMERVSDEFPDVRPAGGYDDAVDALAQAAEDSQTNVTRLWGAVPNDAMPQPSTARIKAAVQDLIDESEAGAKHMPSEAATIMGYGDNITARELQGLRSEVLTSIRLGNRANPTDAALRQKGRAVQILKAIDETELAAYPPGMSAPLDEARAATAKHKDVFSMKRNAIEALTERTDPKQALQRIRSAKDAPGEARNVAALLREYEGGIEGLRATIFDDIFGSTLGEKSVRSMRSNLRNPKNRKIYEEILDPKQLEVLDNYVEKWAMASSGVTGGGGQARGTGTGYELLDLANIVKQGRTLGGLVDTFARWGFKKVTGSSKQEMALIRLATQDIDIADVLLGIPAPEKIPAMKAIWNSAVDASLEVAETTAKRSPEASARGLIRE